MAPFDSVIVGGVKTACLSRSGLIALMTSDCEKARAGDQPPKLIFDVNGHGLALARWDKNYRQTLDLADIVHADGQAIVLASRLLTNTPIPERSATTDFFHDCAACAVSKDLRFYLLGATEDVNEQCAFEAKQLYPGLQIVGRRNGFFERGAERQVCDEINRLNVDVLWVGLGKPGEQAFCVRNRERLRVGWIVTCGGCFNYVVGVYPRAPEWMQSSGLEWLHRLLTHPKKLFWRYVTTNPTALYLLLTKTRSSVAAQDTRHL